MPPADFARSGTFDSKQAYNKSARALAAHPTRPSFTPRSPEDKHEQPVVEERPVREPPGGHSRHARSRTFDAVDGRSALGAHASQRPYEGIGIAGPVAAVAVPAALRRKQR